MTVDARGVIDVLMARQSVPVPQLAAPGPSQAQIDAAFALALRLSPEDTQTLLASAGFALSSSAPFDLIIRFFIERGVYDLFQINDALDAFGQPILMT